MKYRVNFSCGHEDVVDLIGPNSDRERKITYFETYGLCPECFKAQKEAEKANGCKEVEMPYREYKAKWADLATKSDSYNGRTKTIIVYMPELEDIKLEDLDILAEVNVPQHNSYCMFDDVKAYLTEISGKLTIIFSRLDRILYTKQAKVGKEFLQGKTQEQLVEIAVNAIEYANNLYACDRKKSPFIPY